jgi:outer membrane protein assembly factor BamB
LRLPLKLSRTIRITKGHLSGVLAADDAGVFLTADADLVHVSGRSGREVWRVPAEDSWVTSVTDGVLLVTTWKSARGISTRSGDTLYRFSADRLRLWRDRWMMINENRLTLIDAVTGRAVEKRSPLPITPSHAGLTRIEGDVMLYQGEDNTQVVAYDLSRQKLLWKRSLQREIGERLGVDVGVMTLRPIEPDSFLAVTKSHVVGCSLEDGRILWDMPAAFDSPALPHRDRVYVLLIPGGRVSPRLVCVEAVTGVKVYDVVQSELDSMDIPSYGKIHDEYVGFGTRGGLLGLFRLADGGLAWSYRHTVRHRTNVPVHMPVIEGERLYACADDGNLLLFEPV